MIYEVEAGLAEEPQWGPMYGAQAVSEQELAEQARAKKLNEGAIGIVFNV